MRTRAIAYLRLSTEKQEDDGVGLDAQRTRIESYARLYEIEIAHVVQETASASTLERPALRYALSLLAAGEASALIVAKLDRLTRNVGDLVRLVERRFANGHLQLLSMAEKIDTRTASGRLVLNVLTSIHQWEREAIVERTKAVLAHKRELGHLVSRLPYGKRLAPDGVHLVDDPGEQFVLRAARDLAAVGMSLRAIADALHERGLRPRKGEWFAAEQIRRMVRGPSEGRKREDRAPSRRRERGAPGQAHAR